VKASSAPSPTSSATASNAGKFALRSANLLVTSHPKRSSRYEIQDIEPELDEDGREPSPYRASVQSLIVIPSATAPLPDLPRGKQVLALYPQTTTFYKAELVGMRKDHCRLRFEGEDEKDKEQDVERRYVLDVAGAAK